MNHCITQFPIDWHWLPAAFIAGVVAAVVIGCLITVILDHQRC